MPSTRREFLTRTALAGAGLWAAESTRAAEPRAAGDRVRFGCIGVGGKGESDSNDAGRLGDVVAICDVDDGTLGRAGQRFPTARKFSDFREMLHTMHGSIDAVTVSIPDHNHAVAAAMAMRLGKHCFVQKPLAHSLYEVRRLSEIAREMKVATQMGNQGTASSGLRKSAALIRAGAIGTVSEVHVWTNRPIWPQGGARPAPKPVPPTLHWDLWLGPAPNRPYGDGYHPFAWRGWWDFGTGALGDMACHTMNMPYMALGLRDPTSVVAHTSGTNHDSYPSWSIIRYEFPASPQRPAVTMTWYDGGKRPPAELLEGHAFSDSGSLVVGTKGKLYTPGDYGDNGQLIGGEPMDVSFPESPGHFEEFIRAAQGGPTAMSNFPDYAGPLAETVLLGNLAVWADGRTIEWDARRLRARNAPEVEPIVRPHFHNRYRL